MGRRTITQYDRDRGKRLRLIREAYNETQPEFARRLNAEARRQGLPERYYDVLVSRNEAGSMTFEDAVVWLAIDPDKRSWEWFVRGGAEHHASASTFRRVAGAKPGRIRR